MLQLANRQHGKRAYTQTDAGTSVRIWNSEKEAWESVPPVEEPIPEVHGGDITEDTRSEFELLEGGLVSRQ